METSDIDEKYIEESNQAYASTVTTSNNDYILEVLLLKPSGQKLWKQTTSDSLSGH